MTPRQTLDDLLKHPGCEVSSATRAKVLSILPREELFVRSRLLDEYIVDLATGLRTRRADLDRIVWMFVPTDDLLKGTATAQKEPKDTRRKRIRAKDGELTQQDVAKDFGVKRQTVIKWEAEQTEDDPGNTSNPYGYYQRLRTDPNLRGAYTALVNAVKPYLAAKARASQQGIRFRVSFERFNEAYALHNNRA